MEQADRSLESQQITVSDLTVTVDGQTFTNDDFDGGATADFANGVFLGVTFDIDRPPTDFPYTNVAVGDGAAQAVGTSSDYTSAAVAYPASGSGLPDTRVTFTLPNGDKAAGSFTMPVSRIDGSQASQQLAVTDLTVTIAGHTFTSADLASGATVDFASGVLQGITFEVSSQPAGFAYTDVSVSDGLVTATDTSSNLVATAVSYTAPAGVAVPQHTVTVDATAGTITVDGQQVGTYSGTEFTFFGETYTAADPASPPPPAPPGDPVGGTTKGGRPPTEAEQAQLNALNALRNQLMAQLADIDKQIKAIQDQIALAEKVIGVTQKALNDIVAQINQYNALYKKLQSGGQLTPQEQQQYDSLRPRTVGLAQQSVLLMNLIQDQNAVLAPAQQKLASLQYDRAKVALKLSEVNEAILAITTAALNNSTPNSVLAPPWVFNPNLYGAADQTLEQALANQGTNKPVGYTPYSPSNS